MAASWIGLAQADEKPKYEYKILPSEQKCLPKIDTTGMDQPLCIDKKAEFKPTNSTIPKLPENGLSKKIGSPIPEPEPTKPLIPSQQ